MIAGVPPSPLQRVTELARKANIAPAGANKLGNMMGRSLQKADEQIMAFEQVHRLMDDGVECILRFIDIIGGEIRTLSGEGSVPASDVWTQELDEGFNDELKHAITEATELFQESRQKHSEAVLRVKELLVNFKQEFQGQDGTTKQGVWWKPLTAVCQEFHKRGQGVGAARVMSQLLDPPFVAPAQPPKARRRLATL